MARIEMEPGWEQEVLAAWDGLANGRLGEGIERDAKRYCPVGPDVPPTQRDPEGRVGGTMRDRITHYMDGHTLIVDAQDPASAYVEMGTRPHIITAHGPYSLHSAATGEYFGREVHHPGSQPQPFMRPALYTKRGE